ncbi:MAG: sigma-70 family RNA polymerase sigma factor [bacterium]
MESEELVKAYKRNPEPELREQVVVQFLPIVKYVIGRMHLTVKNKAEIEDIHSAGILGLLHALEDFDVARNTKFKTYATWRVRGFILDYLRQIDFLSRTDRAKIRAIERVIAELTQKYGREPSNQEIAQEIDVDLTEFNRLLELTQLNFIVPFDQKQALNDEQITLSEVIADESNEGPFEQSSKSDLLNLVKEAIGNLPERLRLIVLMYYNDEMTLAEIGKVLCLSESRVSRLLGKALLSIRQEILEINVPSKVPI